ncbi:hypothetical protein VTL71DRAFT_7528 [Oculimacula yallundae]|uniref:F-box domain-containing protein n=1 Tax=Oculimacula yallundae TaxID=86028 RepID=A0ABR4BUD3_9HELO
MTLCQHPDCLRLTDDSAIIIPQKLTFTSDLDEVRNVPLINNKRKSVCGRGHELPMDEMRSKVSSAKRPRLSKGEVQIQLARKPRRLGTLGTLPSEIILKIIRALEEDANILHYNRVQDFGLVSLALTSIDLYKMCKCVHPAPLPTTRGDGMLDKNRKFWAWSLERHIGEFLGPAYQVRDRDDRYGFYTRIGSPFLLKSSESDKMDADKDGFW